VNIRVAVLFSFACAAVACGQNRPADSSLIPSAPSAVTATSAGPSGVVGAMQGRTTVHVNMLDACDPDTFNAPPLEPGTCVRNGGVTFAQFIAELTRLGSIGPWRFSPSNGNVEVGQTFVAVNMGGERHTFTEVADFGGGVVPLLNDLSHAGDIVPECRSLDDDDMVAPGGTYTEVIDHPGTVKFQCCIHPWMRLEATSR
jgi:plastocyanin